MIYVTQGHEKGIGLEVFLKSWLMLSKAQRPLVTLVADKDDLEENYKFLKIEKNLYRELLVLLAAKTTSDKLPSSTTTLLKALEIITDKDVLVTLPTSKDQLFYNGKMLAGYTEFFRNYYNNKNIAMTFKGFDQDVLLITDHISLKDVPHNITCELVVNKIETATKFFAKYFYTFDEIILSGINPHVGENGILGKEDEVLFKAKDVLAKTLPIEIKGPFSGDTLHTHKDQTKKQLFTYMYHDQGLAPFKSKFGFVGLNISMGLPFLRLSVDHGTAFELYGKNKGDMSGMLYLFKIAFEVNHHVNP